MKQDHTRIRAQGQVTRRGFLRVLALVSAAVGYPSRVTATARAKPVSYDLTIFHVAGFQYHDGPAHIHLLRDGQRYRLAAEPTNPHDPFAVRIEWEGKHLGYVPACREPDHPPAAAAGGGTHLQGRARERE